MLSSENEKKLHAVPSWAHPTQFVTELVDTQFLDDMGGSELATPDVGKKVSEYVRELFVVCEPAEALRQHFDVSGQPFMAIHDLGTGRSRQFLAALAAASGWPLKHLQIRRQGFGTILATLFYLDCPALKQRSLRLYASETEAEPAVRASLRRLLLGMAAANAVLVEDLAEQVSSNGFAQLREDLVNRHRASTSVLLMPQRRSDTIVRHISALQAGGSGVRIEVAPVTGAIAVSWALMATYWNRETGYSHRPDMPVIDQISLGPGAPAPLASKEPLPNELVSSRANSTAGAPAAGTRVPATPAITSQRQTWLAADYLREAMRMTAAQQGCIFNIATLAIDAHSGSLPAATLAQQAQAFLVTVAKIGNGLSLGRTISETTVTFGSAYLLIRPVRWKAGSALVLVLNRSASAGAWRQELEKLDAK